MDVYYETSNPNAPCDKYMDWHNNYVGRVTKYDDFRISTNWETWGVKVKNFIDNSNNGIKMNWNTSTPKATVKKQEKKASDTKYIYWKN